MGGIILVIGAVFLYFLPTIIATQKKKPNKTSILVLNLFLGWTLVGWVVALIWAVSKNEAKAVIVQNAPASSAGELEKLAQLKEKGVITQAEFEKQKQKILS